MFTPLKTVIGLIRKLHVRQAVVAGGEVAVLADLSNYPEQACEMLKEVGTSSSFLSSSSS